MMKFKLADLSDVIVLPLLVLFVFFSALIISYSNPFRVLENQFSDRMFEIRGPLDVSDSPIVLVAISQAADEEIPFKYPWPTRFYAKLIENLNKAGASAIGIDVIIDKADPHGPENDSLFAAALKEYGNVVLAGNITTTASGRGEGTRSIATSFVEPYAPLNEANPNPYGLVRVVRDRDDTIRRYLLSMEFNQQKRLSLGLEVLKVYHGWDNSVVSETETYFQLGDYRIPKYDAQTMAINYFTRPNGFVEHSFETVIDDSTVVLVSEDEDFQLDFFSDSDFGLLQSGTFEDKIVLVGATMPELHDFHSTPYAQAGTRAGYEIHANAIQTILSGQHLYHSSVWANLVTLFLISLLVVLVTKYTNAWLGFVLFVIETIAIMGIGLFLFLEQSLVIEFTGPLLAVAVGYFSTLSYDYLKEQKEKKRIRNMFSSYVSPALVNRMIESGQEPKLGGDEVNITAFFSDIQSFSAFSEQLEPKALVELINEYLSAMTDIITGEGGTLDKYIGDAIVAFFGAPLPQEDHAYRACVTSQLMQRKLIDLREKWRSEGDHWPQIVHNMQNRIGMNTGLSVTGNMGSTSRFNYTMMGDNVNLAARCESGAKAYGVYTMVTEETKTEAEKFGDRCVFRYLDRIVVMGRTQPVKVYEILGLKEHVEDEARECIRIFEEGIEAYLQQDWNRAAVLFEESVRLEPNRPERNPRAKTNPSQVYTERCERMAEEPPDEEWDGVYIMETK